MALYSLYVLRCSDDTLYTGIATDIERRLEEHASSPRGAKYLRGRLPFRLLCAAEIGDRSAASRAELRFKRLDKSEKERLVADPKKLHARLTTPDGPAGEAC